MDDINIASQIQFLNIIYEVLQEAIIAPLFFVLKGISNKLDFNARIGIVFIVICMIYLLMFVCVFSFTAPFLEFIKQKEHLIPATITYIRLESFNFLLAVIVQFFVVIAII